MFLDFFEIDLESIHTVVERFRIKRNQKDIIPIRDLHQGFQIIKKMSGNKKKSARLAGTFSSRASRASLSAPRARDSIVALRAPFFLDLALRARSCALRIRLSLFLII